MTEDDGIRRALSAYAAGAPDTDPRAALPATLARRRQVRLVSAAGVALAVVMGVAGFAALGQHQSPSDSITAAEDESPEPSASERPSTQPSPSTSPSASESASSVVLPPSATAVPSPSSSGEDPPVDELRVSMSGPTSLSTAQYATFPVRASDPYYYVGLDRISWGDGAPWTGYAGGHYSGVPCANPPAPKPHTLTDNGWEHAWRHPGTYVVEASVSTWRCDRDRPLATRTVQITLVVKAGQVMSNGPKQPILDVEIRGRESSSRLMAGVHGAAKDLDGYLTQVEIDWGDGQHTVIPPQEKCADGDGRHYPDYTLLNIQDQSPSSPPGAGAGHYYEAPGMYTVVVRATSTGCDGQSPQQVSESATVTIPPMNTSASPAAER
jgi:hypothetical protein